MTENLGQRAQRWFKEEGFTVELLSDPSFLSLYNVYNSASAGRRIAVSQAVNDDKLVLATAIRLNDDEIRRLSTLQPWEVRSMFGDLLSLLNGRPTLFNVERKGDIPKQVSVSSLIYSDGFSKDRLMTAISETFKTQALILLRINAYLERADASSNVTRPIQDRTAGPPAARQSASGVGGARAAARPSPPVCPSCGEPLVPGDKFCGNCGRALV